MSKVRHKYAGRNGHYCAASSSTAACQSLQLLNAAVLTLLLSPPRRGDSLSSQRARQSFRWWCLYCGAAALSCRRCAAATIGPDKSKAHLLLPSIVWRLLLDGRQSSAGLWAQELVNWSHSQIL